MSSTSRIDEYLFMSFGENEHKSLYRKTRWLKLSNEFNKQLDQIKRAHL